MKKTIDLKQILNDGGLDKAANFFWRLWVRSFRYVLLAMIAAMIAYVAVIWYQNLYLLNENSPTATEEANARKEKVKFNQVDFEETAQDIERKRASFVEQPEPVVDIFFVPTVPAVADELVTPVVEDAVDREDQIADDSPDANSDESILDFSDTSS